MESSIFLYPYSFLERGAGDEPGRADQPSPETATPQRAARGRAIGEHGEGGRASCDLVVSKAIADLERTIGVRLLDRTAQGVEPTLYGRALVKRSVAIFNDLRASVSEIEFLADRTAGELRIGAIELAATGLLPELIDRLAREYPRLSFEVVQGDPVTLEERELRGRRIELAMMRTTSRERAEDLDETILFSDRLRV